MKMKIAKLREHLSELEHQVAAHQQRGLGRSRRLTATTAAFNSTKNGCAPKSSLKNAKALRRNPQAEERCHAASNELSITVTERLAAAETALAQHMESLEAKARGFAAGGERPARASGTVAPGAVRHAFSRRSGFVPPPQRTCGAGSAETGQRLMPTPRKNFPPKKFNWRSNEPAWNPACRNLRRASRWKN